MVRRVVKGVSLLLAFGMFGVFAASSRSLRVSFGHGMGSLSRGFRNTYGLLRRA